MVCHQFRQSEMRGEKRAAGLPWQRTRCFPSALGFHMPPGYAAREPGGLTVAVQLQMFNKKAFQHLQEPDVTRCFTRCLTRSLTRCE